MILLVCFRTIVWVDKTASARGEETSSGLISPHAAAPLAAGHCCCIQRHTCLTFGLQTGGANGVGWCQVSLASFCSVRKDSTWKVGRHCWRIKSCSGASEGDSDQKQEECERLEEKARENPNNRLGEGMS